MKPHNLDVFKDNFIKEYITVRNQIIPSNPVMRRKWRADPDGLVYAYSSIDVYSSFMKTDLWHAIMVGKYEPLTFRCDVSFDKIVPRKIDRESEKYAVMFRWICSDESTGQSTTKDFTIAIGLAFQTSLNRDERLDNPLGLKVVEYEPETGVDPLNWLQVVEYEPDAGGEPKAGGDPLNRPQEE
jgi:type IV secretory pathway component VirB8